MWSSVRSLVSSFGHHEGTKPTKLKPKAQSLKSDQTSGFMFQILKRSSNACRALGGPAVPVCRSMVVRAEKKLHSFRPSFGATRAVSVCVHSQRALVSNDMQLIQLCRSAPQRAQRPSNGTGSARRLPQRAQRKTSCEPIRFGVFGPDACCSGLPGARGS